MFERLGDLHLPIFSTIPTKSYKLQAFPEQLARISVVSNQSFYLLVLGSQFSKTANG